jgi:uncharacterized protein (DUF2235 family)
MSKSVILLSDGTGNSSAKLQRTNVWRLFQAIDQSKPDQVAMYDDGVGTARARLLAMMGGAFGWGLKRNILDLYKFACRNYRRGDQIYAFGFSRGAFTVRTLIGFISYAGLVDFNSEEELDIHAIRAYRAYRRHCFMPTRKGASNASPVTWMQRVGKFFENAPLIGMAQGMPSVRVSPDDVQIRFIGLWDTVGAYGMPLRELKPAISFLFWPIYWRNRTLPKQVKEACHALSLDDQRTTFHPILWEADNTNPKRITQVWFSGVHANLGGGYPEDKLSLVSLNWISERAALAGLRLHPTHVARIKDEQSPFGKLYDSRKGLQNLYRYEPRKVIAAVNDNSAPLIHHSVIERLVNGTDNYAPSALPLEFKVLAPSGGEAVYRRGNIVNQAVMKKTDPHLLANLARIKKPDVETWERSKDAVWWRRVFYYITMSSVIFLLALPITGELLQEIYKLAAEDSPIVEPFANYLVTTFADVAQPFYPGFLSWWFEAVKAYPYAFAAGLYMLTFSMYFGHRQKRRLRDLTLASWLPRTRARYVRWLADYAHRAFWTFGGVTALLSIGLFVVLFTSPTQSVAWPLPTFFVANIVLFGAPMAQYFWVKTRLKKNRSSSLPTFSLTVAKSIRTCGYLVMPWRLWSTFVVPTFLGGWLVFFLIATMNHGALIVRGMIGRDCTSSRTVLTTPPGKAEIATKTYCAGTGIELQAQHTYRIELQVKDQALVDGGWVTDLGGYEARLPQVFKAFTRRHWTENFFVPVARVGKFGAEEYVLSPRIAYPTITNGTHAGSTIRKRLVTTLRPKQSGELFMYVNDTALGIDGLRDIFYNDNIGVIKLNIAEVIE